MHCCLGRKKAKNLPTLNLLISKGVLKMCTAENVAGSGLQLTHLKQIFQRGGEDGLLNTFVSPNSEGQPKVTNVKRTLESVIPKLVDFWGGNELFSNFGIISYESINHCLFLWPIHAIVYYQHLFLCIMHYL